MTWVLPVCIFTAAVGVIAGTVAAAAANRAAEASDPRRVPLHGLVPQGPPPSPGMRRRPGPVHYCVCPLHKPCACGREVELRRVATDSLGGSGWEVAG